MKATWQDDLQALREERRLILTNLRLLRQRALKEGRRLSISTYHEIEDMETKLKEVDKAIKTVLSRHTDTALELERSPFEDSPYVILDPAAPSSVSNSGGVETPSPVDYVWGMKKSQLLIGALLIVGLLTLLVWTLRSRSGGATQETISIHLGYYHLGDAPLSDFHKVYPDQNPFIVRFNVTRPVETAQLSLTVSHVDPDEKQSPVILSVNGNFVGYLNSYVYEENLRAETILIPINSKFFFVGINEIKIEVMQTSDEYGLPNLDDLEFWDAKLLLK